MSKPTRALITGASSGIGEAFAQLLAKDGVNLVLVARRSERLEVLAKNLTEKYKITVECYAIDIALPASAQKLLDFCTKDGKNIDLVVNNAGSGPYRKFLDAPVEQHLQTINLNATALTEISHRFGSHMISHGKPSYILNVASVAAYQAAPYFSVYAATKTFVKVFSQVLREELIDTNVSVTCLCPGPTSTEFMKSNNQKVTQGQSFFMSAEECARIGLVATYAKKSVIIPGLLNKVSCWIARFMPSSLAIRLSGKAMALGVQPEN